MSKTLLEQMLEHVINEDKEQAQELFHQYVVEKSREIYESLIEDDFELEESDELEFDDSEEADLGGDATDDLADELDAEVESDEGGDEVEDMFDDLESIVDELQAKFNELSGGESDEEEFDLNDSDDEEIDLDDSDDEEIDLDDSDDEEVVREYVEKVSPKMGDHGDNTKSTVAGKNDMGGTAKNIAQGGASKGEGTKGGLAAPSAKEDNAGNVNKPGGKAGVKHLKSQPGHGAEKKGSGDMGDKSAQSIFRGRR